MTDLNKHQKWKILLSFTCIYVIWGSTYLAIKYAIADVSPLLMTGARFALSSIILIVVSLVRREEKLSGGDLKIAISSGVMLTLANALVCVSERWIASGTTAVLCGASPVMILLLNWLFFEQKRPRTRQVLGILISFLGVVLLSRSTLEFPETGFAGNSTVGVLAILGALILWGVGSLSQRRAGALPNIFRFTTAQAFSGCICVSLLGIVSEHPSQIHLANIALSGYLAFLYLAVFGSAIAFSAYLFLHRHVEPGKVSTYAVVNPVIAVWLGWLIAGERVGWQTIVDSLLVVIGLYFAVISALPRTKINRKLTNKS